MRREDIPGALVLTGHPDRVPAPRPETAAGRRALLRQNGRPVLLARRRASRTPPRPRLAGLGPGQGPARRVLNRAYAGALAAVPYAEGPAPTWPIPGGADERDAWMLEFRHEHDRHEPLRRH
ncbi:hypothetical protein [Streptomyces roseicoloratus]|uniref:hypothetical protein n=1 Tax=Streptomyces roseicoloratus TaxID=2508722 RepID=UPI001009DA53|nr:hypothetical protein [Streptomyces roseicoloratus]